MKAVFTTPALVDLEELFAYAAGHYPQSALPLAQRIDAVLDRIRRYPQSATLLGNQAGVRVVPLIRYPYRIFYRISGDKIEILHIRHSARAPWAG